VFTPWPNPATSFNVIFMLIREGFPSSRMHTAQSIFTRVSEYLQHHADDALHPFIRHSLGLGSS
jgi:hypothetical protein